MRREAPGRAGSAWVSVAGLRGRGLPLAAPVRRAQPRPCVRSFSCTVFTFGQTGSGKTYTLTGPPPQVGSGAEPAGSALWEGLRVVGGAPGWRRRDQRCPAPLVHRPGTGGKEGRGLQSLEHLCSNLGNLTDWLSASGVH